MHDHAVVHLVNVTNFVVAKVVLENSRRKQAYKWMKLQISVFLNLYMNIYFKNLKIMLTKTELSITRSESHATVPSFSSPFNTHIVNSPNRTNVEKDTRL